MTQLSNDQVTALDNAFFGMLGAAGVHLAGIFSLGTVVNVVGGGSSSDVSLVLSQPTGTALSVQPNAYIALDGTAAGATPSHGFQYNSISGNVNLVGANLNVSGGFGFFGSSLQAASFMQAGAGRFNQLTMDGSATGVGTTITATGGDPSIDIFLNPKGVSGKTWLQGSNAFVDANGQIVAAGAVKSEASVQAGFSALANQITLAGSAASSPVTLTASGSDSSIGISLVDKGSGGVLMALQSPLYLDGSTKNVYIKTDGAGNLIVHDGYADTNLNIQLTGTGTINSAAGIVVGTEGQTHIYKGATSVTSANPGASVEILGGLGWASDNVSPATAGGGVVIAGGTGGAGAAAQAAGIGVGVTILGGNAGAANGGPGASTGDIIIDVGQATGAGTNGDIDIGATHATGVHIGHGGAAAPAKLDGDVWVATKIAQYGGLTTTGLGVPVIVDQGAATGSTSGSGILSFHTVNSGIFELGGYIQVTAWTSGTITFNMLWTDVEGGPHNVKMFGLDASGGPGVNSLAGVGLISISSQTIYAQAGSDIQISVTSPGTATYDIAAWIKQIA